MGRTLRSETADLPPLSFSRRGWAASLLRMLVALLILPLATSGALPLWAELAGVEGPHQCHCSTEKHDCICSKCNPDHQDEMLLSSESLKGRCGDDDVAFGGKAICAVLAAKGGLCPIAEDVAPPGSLADPQGVTTPPPPTPPPRVSSSSAV